MPSLSAANVAPSSAKAAAIRSSGKASANASPGCWRNEVRMIRNRDGSKRAAVENDTATLLGSQRIATSRQGRSRERSDITRGRFRDQDQLAHRLKFVDRKNAPSGA